MEGFEKFYLFNKTGKPKFSFACTRNVTLKDYFATYSERLSSIMPRDNIGTKAIMKNILQDDEEISSKDLHKLRKETNKHLFRNEKIYLASLSAQEKKDVNREENTQVNIGFSPEENTQVNIGFSPEENTPTSSGRSKPSFLWDDDDIPSTSRESTLKNGSKGTVTTYRRKRNVQMSREREESNDDESNVSIIALDSDSEEEASCVDGNYNTHKTQVAKQPASKTTLKNGSRDSVKTYERKRNVQTSREREESNDDESNVSIIALDSDSEEEASCVIGNCNTHKTQYSLTAAKQLESKTTLKNGSRGSVKTYERKRNVHKESSCSTKTYKGKGISLKMSDSELNKSPRMKSLKQAANKNKSHVHKTSKKVANISKLKTVVMNEERLPSPVKLLDVKEQSHGNKPDLFLLLNEAISEDSEALKKPPNKKGIEQKSKIASKSFQSLDINPQSFSDSLTVEKENKSDAHDPFKDNSEPCKESYSEAIEIVSQILETLLLNIKSDSECLVQKSGTEDKTVSYLNTNMSPGESLTSSAVQTNIVGGSIEIEENSYVQCNQESAEKELLRPPSEGYEIVSQVLDTLILNVDNVSSKDSSATENQSIFKVPEGQVRRGARKRIKKKTFDYQEDIEQKYQAEIPRSSKKKNKIPENGNGESVRKRLASILRDMVRKPQVRYRPTRRLKERLNTKRQCRTVRGTVIVDTTRKLGKKNLIPKKNFVISFRIHKPFTRLVGESGTRPGKCQQEIEVLNYQTLEDLRNVITCESDYQYLSGDISEWPHNPVTELALEKYKGAMFYINNTFYINTEEGAEDYSKVIREWAEARGINLGETKPMHSVKVEDLKLRHGYPYVYVHQGACEHLVIVRQSRLLMKKRSSLHSSDYPNLTKISKSAVYYCVACTTKPAKWLVKHHEMLINDYNFFCDKCFHKFNYIGTEKVGDFKAYYFKQRAVLFY